MDHMDEGDFVFKHYIWDTDYELADYEFMRMDAIVAERLYGNPRIVDIYGYCALGMLNEAMQNGDIEDVAVPSERGRDSDKYRGLENSKELRVFNDLSGTKKLEYALDMAEAVLLLHSYPGGVIVHDGTSPAKLCFLSCVWERSRHSDPLNLVLTLFSRHPTFAIPLIQRWHTEAE